MHYVLCVMLYRLSLHHYVKLEPRTLSWIMVSSRPSVQITDYRLQITKDLQRLSDRVTDGQNTQYAICSITQRVMLNLNI